MALYIQIPDTSSSFRAEYTARSSGFRTPPPPLDSVEPLSPPYSPASANPAPRLDVKKRKLADSEISLQEALYPPQKSQYLYSHIHTSSAPSHVHPADGLRYSHQAPSALDLFAAVATSPSLAQAGRSPTCQENYARSAFPADAPIHLRAPQDGRPSKRSRSEVIDARSILDAVSRPATSHIPQMEWGPGYGRGYTTYATDETDLSRRPAGGQDPKVEDAELLLSFAYGANFKPNLHGSSHQQVPLVQDNSPAALVEQFRNDHDRGRHHGKEDLQINASNTARDNVGTNSFDRRKTDSAFVENASRGQYTMKDQMIKRPGALPPVKEQTDALGGSDPVQDQPVPKPRTHRGWPKGKPRGPRTQQGQAKQTKKPASKPRLGNAAIINDTRIQDLTQPLHSSILSKIKEGLRVEPKTSNEDQAESPVVPYTSIEPLDHWRPRFASEVPMSSVCRHEVPMPPRRHSSPPTFSLPSVKSSTGGTQPRKRAKDGEDSEGDKQANLCTACQSKSTPNGYHDLWITCNGCKLWFHTACVGFKNEREVRDVDKFYCSPCETENQKTTFVRKSNRAHVSVDYAGLNEGMMRTSTDTVEHHYIQPFKDGTIEIQPESFPRMRPELVTAEFFERSGAMTEPVLIPAEWNPRPFASGASHEGLHRGPEDVSADQTDFEWFSDSFEYDCVPDDGQDKLGMVMPQGLNVPMVAELVGPEERVEVIDVKSQEGGDNRWNLRKWAEYYEATGEKPVRNVISLEVSQTKLGKLIQRPKIVRDLDLQDAVWPQDELAKGNYPQVQFYCLMSVQDCYTDFHIDFGGSSVYYHILKGSKTFFFIPPKKQHLKAYEQWCLSSNQGATWLGSLTKECYRVDLSEGDTMLIPSGWIHSVWTPSNSLVIGGNFLTRMHYGMQISINEIEKATGVGRRFRYPHFQKVLWYAVIQYLEEDPVPSTVAQILYNGGQFERSRPTYHDFDEEEHDDPEQHHSRYYSQGEIEGLVDLLRFVYRTVMISLDKVQGISKSTKEAVVRSMPKGYGEHLDLLRTFALWVAWKRGNAALPQWAHPEFPASEMEVMTTDKKPGVAGLKKADLPPERRSSRQPKEKTEHLSPVQPKTESEDSTKGTSSGGSKSAPGPRRIACEACRKRRIRCKHKEAEESYTPGPVQRFGIKAVHEATPEPTPVVEQEPVRPWAPVAVMIPQKQESPIVTPQTPSTTQTGSSKVKACDECRKSKRRCIHDEYGNIDPVKASQTPVPRAYSASKTASKRGRPDGDSDSQSPKKIKIDEQEEAQRPGAIVTAPSGPQSSAPSQPSGEPMADQRSKKPPNHGISDVTESTEHQSAYPDEASLQAMDNPFAWASESIRQSQRALAVLQHADPGVKDLQLHDNTQNGQTLYDVEMTDQAPISDVAALQPTSEMSDASPDATAALVDGTAIDDRGQARSRTPSSRINTSSTGSGDVTGSAPSSPLTELDPSSPVADKDVENTSGVMRTKEEDSDLARRYKDRSSSRRTVAPIIPAAQVDARKRQSRTPVGKTPSQPATSKRGSESRSHKGSLSRATSVNTFKGSPGNTSALSPSLDPEEEESLRLARELSSMEWGLRRRGSVTK